MADEGKRIANLIINGAVIGLTVLSLLKVSNVMFPKALPTPRLAFATYDLTANIVHLSIDTPFHQLLASKGVFPLIK